MEVAVSGRRASVRGRRKAAAGWRSQARGVDLRNVLGGAGNAHEADVPLGLAVPDPPPHGREVGGETGPESLWSGNFMRSEEHTSELQSLMRTSYAVFCLKKKHN